MIPVLIAGPTIPGHRGKTVTLEKFCIHPESPASGLANTGPSQTQSEDSDFATRMSLHCLGAASPLYLRRID
jgi:hypothetical protein